jgi:hypothetical protein
MRHKRADVSTEGLEKTVVLFVWFVSFGWFLVEWN